MHVYSCLWGARVCMSVHVCVWGCVYLCVCVGGTCVFIFGCVGEGACVFMLTCVCVFTMIPRNGRYK